jgi:hypothetical protein
MWRQRQEACGMNCPLPVGFHPRQMLRRPFRPEDEAKPGVALLLTFLISPHSRSVALKGQKRVEQ